MNSLRQQAWWLMRQRGVFTLNDLLLTLSDGTEKNAYRSLMKYVGLLERVGILQRLKRKEPGISSLSRGRVIWRLARDLGRNPPIAKSRDTIIFDPNSQTTLTEKPVADRKNRLVPPEFQHIHDARHTVLAAVRNIQRRDQCALRPAIEKFLEEVRERKVDQSLFNALYLSVMHLGGGGKKAVDFRVPSMRTIMRWASTQDLMPKIQQTHQEKHIQPWMLKAIRISKGLRIYSMQEVHRRLVKRWNPEWGKPVSYTALWRFLRGDRKTVSLEKISSAEVAAMSQGDL